MHKIFVIEKEKLQDANQVFNNLGAYGESFFSELVNDKNELVGFWSGWNTSDEILNLILQLQYIRVFNSQDEAISKTGWKPKSAEWR